MFLLAGDQSFHWHPTVPLSSIQVGWPGPGTLGLSYLCSETINSVMGHFTGITNKINGNGKVSPNMTSMARYEASHSEDDIISKVYLRVGRIICILLELCLTIPFFGKGIGGKGPRGLHEFIPKTFNILLFGFYSVFCIEPWLTCL